MTLKKSSLSYAPALITKSSTTNFPETQFKWISFALLCQFNLDPTKQLIPFVVNRRCRSSKSNYSRDFPWFHKLAQLENRSVELCLTSSTWLAANLPSWIWKIIDMHALQTLQPSNTCVSHFDPFNMIYVPFISFTINLINRRRPPPSLEQQRPNARLSFRSESLRSFL